MAHEHESETQLNERRRRHPADQIEFDRRMEQSLKAIHEAAEVRINLMAPAGLRLACQHCEGVISGPLDRVKLWLPDWLDDHKHPEKSGLNSR